MRIPPAKRPRKRSKRGAVLLAIGVGLGGGLLLAGPLSELLSDNASGASNAITNPFAAWSGITNQDILLLGTDVGGGNTDVIASLRVDGGITRITQAVWQRGAVNCHLRACSALASANHDSVIVSGTSTAK